MNKSVKILFTTLIIATFVAVGVFGFMFMMHDNGAVMAENCPIGTSLPQCPVGIFAHLDAWKNIVFDLTQIVVLLAMPSFAIISVRKLKLRTLLAHKIRDWTSRKTRELQLLYSILFSDGIIQAKITPDYTY